MIIHNIYILVMLWALCFCGTMRQAKYYKLHVHHSGSHAVSWTALLLICPTLKGEKNLYPDHFMSSITAEEETVLIAIAADRGNAVRWITHVISVYPSLYDFFCFVLFPIWSKQRRSLTRCILFQSLKSSTGGKCPRSANIIEPPRALRSELVHAKRSLSLIIFLLKQQRDDEETAGLSDVDVFLSLTPVPRTGSVRLLVIYSAKGKRVWTHRCHDLKNQTNK